MLMLMKVSKGTVTEVPAAHIIKVMMFMNMQVMIMIMILFFVVFMVVSVRDIVAMIVVIMALGTINYFFHRKFVVLETEMVKEAFSTLQKYFLYSAVFTFCA